VRKRLNTIGGILLLGALAWMFYPYFGAEKRVRQVCELIKPEMTYVDVERISLDHGMSLPGRYLPRTYIVENRTFGRYGCRIDMREGRVTAANYDFAD
jgi:hypothetical protein